MKATHYIVQTSPTLFVHKDTDDEPEHALIEACGLGQAKYYAAEHKANRVWKQTCEHYSETRRFPRIIKVTTETKTIRERR